MARGFTFYGMDIIQGAPLFWYFLAKYVRKETPRNLQKFKNTRQFKYTHAYAFAHFLFLVSLSYSIVAPFILYAAVIVFLFGYVIMKYQLFHVYESKQESGGEWWPLTFSLICLSLGYFQVVTFLSIANSTGVSQPPAIYVSILPLITLCYWYYSSKFYSECTELTESEEPCSCSCPIMSPVFIDPLIDVWVHDQQNSELESVQSTH